MKKILHALVFVWIVIFFHSCQTEPIEEHKDDDVPLHLQHERQDFPDGKGAIDDALQKRIDFFNKKYPYTFFQKYGELDSLHSLRLLQEGKPALTIYELRNKNKILVSWEDAGLHYRIINVNQKLSGRTTQNTPIPSSIFQILSGKNLEEPVL